MSGIYGICEPGGQLPVEELELMSSAMPTQESRRQRPIGGNGVLLGAAPGLTPVHLAMRDGLLVAVDADLCNHAALLAEHQKSNGGSIASVADLVAVLYDRYGLDFVERLEGAFSLALWDPKHRTLVLTVDRFGFKTLYWSFERGRISFASRLAGVAAAKQHSEVDPAAVMQFLIHTVIPAPLTIYQGVERLEPATLLVYERGQTRRTRYWDVNYSESHSPKVSEWADELRECMRQAVHSHLAGCQAERTGSYLSGGTDSSSVAAFASEVHSPFNTFSIYFDNLRYDETSFSRLAAEQFRTRHHEKCLQVNDALDAIPKLVEYYDEPFGNSSSVGSYYCARLARENGVDVLLAGDGGDELFAGNERYATDKKFAVYHSIPEKLRGGLIKPLAGLLPKAGPLSYPARYIRRAETPNPRRMLRYSFFLTEATQEVFEPDFLEQAKPELQYEIAEKHFNSAPQASSELNRLLYMDVKMTLGDNDLRKVVGTADLAGVCVRFPLLDRRLVELSGRIPSHLKLRGLEKRYIFKQAMKSILPDRILHKKKHGFGVPVGYWLVQDPQMRALADLLDEPQARQRGYFRPEFLSHLKQVSHTHPAYYGEGLWMLLVLELWQRRHRECSTGGSATYGVGAANAS